MLEEPYMKPTWNLCDNLLMTKRILLLCRVSWQVSSSVYHSRLRWQAKDNYFFIVSRLKHVEKQIWNLLAKNTAQSSNNPNQYLTSTRCDIESKERRTSPCPKPFWPSLASLPRYWSHRGSFKHRCYLWRIGLRYMDKYHEQRLRQPQDSDPFHVWELDVWASRPPGWSEKPVQGEANLIATATLKIFEIAKPRQGTVVESASRQKESFL